MPADDPIKHVVLLMMENHSFDQMLGCLQDVHSGLDGVDIAASVPRSNPDIAGNPVYQIPTDEQQVLRDPIHETPNVLVQLSNGNTGFVRDYQHNVPLTTADDRQNVMGYYVLDRLPALHQLGRDFTVCDRWFSSLPGPTWPNRFFALSGTSSGRVKMPSGVSDPHPEEFNAQTQPTIFDRLNDVGKPWKIYYYDFPLSLLFTRQRLAHNLQNYYLVKDFFEDAKVEETFPAFAFIEPKYLGADQNDDHPPHNVFKAQKLIADVYNAIRSNPLLWQSTLLVVSYDEHGGFFDHVEPPAAIPPDEHRDEWTFDRLGVRVPALLVSPWVGRGVDHTQFDHTSLLKYLADKWGFEPLGYRTAAAKSIGSAINQGAARSDTAGFIRVPYTDLMPDNPAVEQTDTSRHHKAIVAFASYLGKEIGPAVGDAIAELARSARWWMRLKAWISAILRPLVAGPARRRRLRLASQAAAVTQVARAVIDQQQQSLPDEAPPASQGSS
jgi:phospholipase C